MEEWMITLTRRWEVVKTTRKISTTFWHIFTCPNGLCTCVLQLFSNLFKRWLIVFQRYLMTDVPFIVIFPWHAFCVCFPPQAQQIDLRLLQWQIWIPLHSQQISLSLPCSHFLFPLYIFSLYKYFEQRFVNCAVHLFILKHLNNKKCLHFVHCFLSVFINHQAYKKYHWSLLKVKKKWTTLCLLMRKIFQWFTKMMKIMMISIPNTSRVDKTSFTVPNATEAISTLRLRQKVKRDKTAALYWWYRFDWLRSI